MELGRRARVLVAVPLAVVIAVLAAAYGVPPRVPDPSCRGGRGEGPGPPIGDD